MHSIKITLWNWEITEAFFSKTRPNSLNDVTALMVASCFSYLSPELNIIPPADSSHTKSHHRIINLRSVWAISQMLPPPPPPLLHFPPQLILIHFPCCFSPRLFSTAAGVRFSRCTEFVAPLTNGAVLRTDAHLANITTSPEVFEQRWEEKGPKKVPLAGTSTWLCHRSSGRRAHVRSRMRTFPGRFGFACG